LSRWPDGNTIGFRRSVAGNCNPGLSTEDRAGCSEFAGHPLGRLESLQVGIETNAELIIDDPRPAKIEEKALHPFLPTLSIRRLREK
jgi:hypothetical protein